MAALAEEQSLPEAALTVRSWPIALLEIETWRVQGIQRTINNLFLSIGTPPPLIS